MNIVIRNCTSADKAWIVSLLKEGSLSGHFGPTVLFQASELVNKIVNNGGFQIMKLRGGLRALCFVRAEIYVAEVNESPASFLITLINGSEVELHLAGTQKQFRRNGCFSNLVKHEIEQHYGRKIIARCYKKSTWAVDGLKKEGFSISKPGDPIELSYGS